MKDLMSREPLISCLCLSRNRPQLLRRAIECFLAQSHSNKEMVVIHPSSDAATVQCIESFGSPLIRSYGVDLPEATLGELRNISVERATGELLCNWDDDDWHSPERLSAQYAALTASKKPAVILVRLLIYDAKNARAYLGCERLWENTALFRKAKIEELGLRYPALNKSEDYEFVNSLIQHNLVYPMLDPTLYIYQFNGLNTSGSAHFDGLLRRSIALSAEQSSVVKSCVEFDQPPQLAHDLMQSERFRSSFRYVRASAVPRT
jgi:glycosyltransferase involved in cell wall biosynthesis